MKYLFTLLIIVFMLSSCQSDAEKAQAKADAMVAEALANAKKMEEEALAKAEAMTKQIEADVAQKQADAAQAKKQAIAAEKANAEQAQAALQHTPNKELSPYNGFYADNRNYHGAFIFVDGKLSFFNCSRFTTVHKNEEYNVRGITSDNKIDIKAQYYKDRKGNIKIKAAVLRDITPSLVDGKCTQFVRAGWTYPRIPTFRAFMKTRSNYSVSALIKDFNAKYNRSEAAIEKAFDNPNYYKADFFQNAPFYGDHLPLADALESIISL